MEYTSILNNYLEYSLDDNHTAINVFFQVLACMPRSFMLCYI